MSALVTPNFAFGINMDVDAMRTRCPSAVMRGAAWLAGYRFQITRHGVATVVASRDTGVHGVLWMLKPQDEAALDWFEGVDDGFYEKRWARVVHQGRLQVARLYVACEHRQGIPRPGYLETILAAARERELPASYCAELVRWQR